MPLQTTFIETSCLVCDQPLTTDIKHGGIRYCFCPDCREWSVFNPEALNESMRQVEVKRYGYDRTAEGVDPEVKQAVDAALDEMEADDA